MCKVMQYMTHTMCLHSKATKLVCVSFDLVPLGLLAVSTPAVMWVISLSAMSLHLHGHIRKQAWAALPSAAQSLSRLRVRRLGAAFLFCSSKRLNNSIVLKPKASRQVKRTNTQPLCSTFLRLHFLPSRLRAPACHVLSFTSHINHFYYVPEWCWECGEVLHSIISY